LTRTGIDINPRKLVDSYCDACGGYGHRQRQSNFVAKLIKSLDYISKLEPAKQNLILAEFAPEQSKQREKKQAATAGKARMLKEAKDAEGLYNLLTQTHQQSDDESSIE
jgi:hypothetical protein